MDSAPSGRALALLLLLAAAAGNCAASCPAQYGATNGSWPLLFGSSSSCTAGCEPRDSVWCVDARQQRALSSQRACTSQRASEAHALTLCCCCGCCRSKACQLDPGAYAIWGVCEAWQHAHAQQLVANMSGGELLQFSPCSLHEIIGNRTLWIMG